MDEIEQELVCCVCLDLYDNPVILPCSHNLCKKCARGLAEASSVPRRIFDCPKCRHKVCILASEGLDGLPENIALKSIVGAVRRHKAAAPTEAPRACPKHDAPRTLYCRSCRLLVCDVCVGDAHSGLGHSVSDAGDVLDESQEKASACASDVRTVLSKLEDQHLQIMKKKDKLAHYERSVQKSLDQEFQALVLRLNMTKMSLSVSAGRVCAAGREAVSREEEACQAMINEALGLLKVLESAERARRTDKKIQKLDSFVTKQSSLMTFRLANHRFSIPDTSLPVVRLSGTDDLRAAIDRVHWAEQEISPDIKCKDSRRSAARGSEDSGVPGPSSGMASSVCDNHQGLAASATTTTTKNTRKTDTKGKTTCLRMRAEPSADPVHDRVVNGANGSAVMVNGNTQPSDADADTSHQGAVGGVSATGGGVSILQGLCCRSKRNVLSAECAQSSGAASLPSTKTCTSAKKDTLQHLMHNLTLAKDKPCTKAKGASVADCGLGPSGSCKKLVSVASTTAANIDPKHNHRINSIDQNGNNNLCPVTNSNRPLFTQASNHGSQDQLADLQALSKSSCNHGNHGASSFFQLAFSGPVAGVSSSGVQSRDELPETPASPDSVSDSEGEGGTSGPGAQREAAGATSLAFNVPVTIAVNGNDDEHTKSDEAAAPVFCFASKSSTVPTVPSAPTRPPNTINHDVEKSPFRATEFFKSMSDPGSPRRDRDQRDHGDQSSGASSSGPDSPPFLVTAPNSRPPLHKSRSEGRQTNDPTSPKPLFTIGFSVSPKAVKRTTIKKVARSTVTVKKT